MLSCVTASQDATTYACVELTSGLRRNDCEQRKGRQDGALE